MPVPVKGDYSNPATPEGYVCSRCGRSGVKLWREYNAGKPNLVCVICAGLQAKVDTSTVDADGLHNTNLGRMDAIGWNVPAIPDEEGAGWWGYTTVPDAGIRWWGALPTRGTDAKS